LWVEAVLEGPLGVGRLLAHPAKAAAAAVAVAVAVVGGGAGAAAYPLRL
jgi:hypothetical protein